MKNGPSPIYKNPPSSPFIDGRDGAGERRICAKPVQENGSEKSGEANGGAAVGSWGAAGFAGRDQGG